MPLEWGYTKENGPETWKFSFPEAGGTCQSPIDIRPVAIKSLGNNQPLSWKYVAENTEYLKNTGYGWKVQVKGEGSSLNGGPLNGNYTLEQFHCHWGATDNEGSEHTIDGQKYAGELHFVHWNSTKYQTFSEACKHPDGLCVLGVFLKPGKKHHELNKIVQQLPKVEYRNQDTKISEAINPGAFMPEDPSFYTYNGSLTTPPCLECVIWIVFKEPIEVSCEQLNAFRNLKSYCIEEATPVDEFCGCVKANFRPTVPLGNREIMHCTP